MVQIVKLLGNPVNLNFTGGVTPKGAYAAGTTYATGDSVSYNGSSYVAIQETTGNLPTNTTYWQVLASKGADGTNGADGATGAAGSNGSDGADGDSAYQVAVTNGFVGTEVQWLASLVGATGAQGPQGAAGSNGSNGTDGADGDSAYVYIAYASADDGTGFTTTFNSALDYIAVLTTNTAIVSPSASDFTGLWKNYKGANGADGAAGLDGADGTNGTNGVGVPEGGTTGQVLSKVDETNFNTQWTTPTTGSGDVVGPAISTDDALVRFDAETGKLIQNSGVTLSDSGNLVQTVTSGYGYSLTNSSTTLTDDAIRLSLTGGARGIFIDQDKDAGSLIIDATGAPNEVSGANQTVFNIDGNNNAYSMAKFVNHAVSSTNNSNVFVQNTEATTTSRGVQIDQAGAGAGVFVDTNSTTNPAVEVNSSKYAFKGTLDIAGGYGLYLTSALAPSASIGLAFMQMTNADSTANVLTLDNRSNGKGLVIKNNTTDKFTIDKDGNAISAGNVSVSDEAYGETWDASTNVPTKNAVYDKIESLQTGISESLALAYSVAL